MNRKFLILLMLFGMLIVACSPSEEPSGNISDDVRDSNNNTVAQNPTDVPPTDEPAPTDIPPTPVPPTEVSTEVPQDTTSQIAYNGPAWTNLPIVNARTGETFTLADFAGKTISVEPMATWCTNCRAQQRAFAGVYDQLNNDNFVIISMSVETHIDSLDLAVYADNNGFDWLFFVVTPEMLSALTEQFGRAVTSPPVVPHFFILKDGTVTDLTTGSRSGQQLVEEMTALHNS